jgi:hypothetical protein
MGTIHVRELALGEVGWIDFDQHERCDVISKSAAEVVSIKAG